MDPIRLGVGFAEADRFGCREADIVEVDLVESKLRRLFGQLHIIVAYDRRGGVAPGQFFVVDPGLARAVLDR